MNSTRLFKPAKIILTIFLFLPLAAQANSNRQFGLGHAFALDSLPSGKLKDRMEKLPKPAKDKAMKWLHGFSFTDKDVKHLRADQEGGIYYEDTFIAPDNAAEGSPVDGLPDSELTNANVFSLHSKPGAQNTVFLDFDGHNYRYCLE